MNECVIEEIKMKHLEENYDIVVVGAGHAGCCLLYTSDAADE